MSRTVNRPRVLFVGAFPPAGRTVFGGMVSDCRALLASTLPQRLDLVLLDTTQISNPPPRLLVRAALAARRFINYVWVFERKRPDAVLLFAATGGSLVEKGAMAWYARLRGVPALLFPRSGRVIDDCNRSRFTRTWMRSALAGARCVLCQGRAGQVFAMQLLGVTATRAPIVNNWTATSELLAIGTARSEPEPSRPVRLLFLGWLDQQKGVMDLLEAIRGLCGERHFVLEFAGEGNVSDAARSYVAKHGLSDCVRFRGWLRSQEVHRALAGADVFVLPSWTEGLPNSMVEAMAARLAIVITQVGNIPDVLTHGRDALLVPPRDVPALRAALASVVDDHQLRRGLADEAFAHAKSTFGVEQAAEDLAAAVHSVIAFQSGAGAASSLSAWCEPGRQLRLQVDRWCAHAPVPAQFIEPPRSARAVWAYLRRVGPLAVARKIASRLAERRRNQKVMGVGLGIVHTTCEGSLLRRGQRVVFFAPNHSLKWSHLVVDAACVVPVEAGSASGEHVGRADVLRRLMPYAGWSPYSGHALDADLIRRELQVYARSAPLSGRCEGAPATPLTPICDQRPLPPPSAPRTARPTAVLFGLGNYAKTQILPNLRRHVQLQTVHEIDPDQLSSAAHLDVALDSAPYPRDDERYDAWFIAGYHHTHGPVAVSALRSGGYAIVEKPLVTTREQFRELEAVVRADPRRRLFTCFQKRYSCMNDWVRRDLRLERGQPVDMHSLVFEIPLPKLHWYNWINSGSRLISNGCHWLDYFLYMNEYSAVQGARVDALRGSDLALWVRLRNGAQLVLSITDNGSPRLGVREVIELRAGSGTVRIVDWSRYEAEDGARVLRLRRINPLEGHARMYETICRAIVSGTAGDTLESLASTQVMLDLEDELCATRRAAQEHRHER